MYNYSSLLLSDGLAATAFADLTPTDVLLFSSGSFDLLQTTAKLDSPDISKIQLHLSSDGGIRIVGEAGCVSTDNVGFVVLIPEVAGQTDSDSEQVLALESDGSFELASGAASSYFLAALSDDQTQSSPFVRIIPQQHDENDLANVHFIFETTHSDTVDDIQNVWMDASGYTYLSVNEDDGETTFLRRHIDGSQIQVIKQNIAEPVVKVSATDGQKITTIDSDGFLKVVIPSSESRTLVTPVPLSAGDEEVVTFERDLLQIADFDADSATVEFHSDGASLIVSQSGDFDATSFVRTVSGTPLSIIKSEWYDDSRVDYSPDLNRLYALTFDEGSWDLSSAELSGSVSLSWINRVSLETRLPLLTLYGLQASADGRVLIDAVSESSERTLFLWTEDDAVQTVVTEDASFAYVNPQWSPDESKIVACRLGDPTQGNQLVLIDPQTHVVESLTETLTVSHCDADASSYHVTTAGWIAFRRLDLQTGFSQMALLKIDFE